MHDQRKHRHLPCCSLVWRLKCQPGLNTWNWLQSVTKQNRRSLNYKTEKKHGSNLNYQTVLATLLTLGVNWKSIPCCCYSQQNPSQQNPATLFLSSEILFCFNPTKCVLARLGTWKHLLPAGHPTRLHAKERSGWAIQCSSGENLHGRILPAF